jgi:hypothetical protein
MVFRGLVFIFFFFLLIPSTYAQPAVDSAAITESAESFSSEDALLVLLDTIKKIEADRASLERQLKRTSDTAASQQIQEELQSLDHDLQDLRNSFEEMATGGLSISTLAKKSKDAPFNWQQELEDIARPILDELKQLTERPRLMERLKSERSVYEDRLQIANSAITELEKTISQTQKSLVKKSLNTLLEQWIDQRESAERRLQRINTQLQRLTAPSDEQGKELITKLQEFASGRGLNLVLALGGFMLVYLLLAGLGRLVSRLTTRRHEPGTRRMARVAALLFQIMAVILSLFTAMLVLYIRDDWLLLGLLLLLTIGLTWGLQRSLPRYVKEIRILLNMGSVREGERIVYNGIPWRIISLNFFTTLRNPMLHGGGIMRLPIDQLVDLQSRPYTMEEPWFPSKEGDIVILEGDIFGKVLLQTPEVVQVQTIGAVTTFSVASYLGKNPRNLSRDGFAVPIVFGLDYQYQGIILNEIVPTLRAYLKEQLAQQPFHSHLKLLLVEFNEAASSSLNLLIVAVFTGAAAEDYWTIRRFLQRTTVSACNQYGWTIPFDQLTVHLPSVPPSLPMVKNAV